MINSEVIMNNIFDSKMDKHNFVKLAKKMGMKIVKFMGNDESMGYYFDNTIFINEEKVKNISNQNLIVAYFCARYIMNDCSEEPSFFDVSNFDYETCVLAQHLFNDEPKTYQKKLV